MPKARKRKAPIAPVSNTRVSSTAAQSCRSTIRQFHILLKRRSQLEGKLKPDASESQTKELADIDKKITSLGGLEYYQKMSILGQQDERGGGSERIFIGWMKEMNVHQPLTGKGKLRLLEIGALKPDNYQTCDNWLECTPMDLHSRHPRIIEQDFLMLDIQKHGNQWDAISLSLVLNFVSLPADRGRMLEMAHSFLVTDGLLFLALPLPCVANSRYLTFEHLKGLMESLGFSEIRRRWRQNGKMGYWLYQKKVAPGTSPSFKKKYILRQGHRNNFAIIVNS